MYQYTYTTYTGDAGPQDVLCEGARHLPSLAERSRGTAAEDAHQGERLLEITEQLSYTVSPIHSACMEVFVP